MTIATLLNPLTKSKSVFTIPVDAKTGNVLSPHPTIYRPNAPPLQAFKAVELETDDGSGKRGLGFLIFSTIMALCAVGFFVGAVVYVMKERELDATPSLQLEGKAGNRTIYLNLPKTADKSSENFKIVKENGELADPQPSDAFVMSLDAAIRPPFFEYRYLMDLNDQWLLLDMPVVPILQVDRPARIFNDFTGNWTVVMDMTDDICYVIPLHQNITNQSGERQPANGQCRCRVNALTGKEYCNMDVEDALVESFYRFGPFSASKLFHGYAVQGFCGDRATYFLLSTDILDTFGSLLTTEHVLRFVDFAAGNIRVIQILRST
ncbi:uncharacterized protein LOC129594433 [Paramacrobiotus metropolitanus]|uniref:uncharacterized protein LOC129594433 n=1 Tax=Paramacrobiotus metropolitanus TaxID=2943436 RepID=UPI0024457ADA|nr:uncharacterized protein LOC129594433 [Paramacrobiotus metropolitanus]